MSNKHWCLPNYPMLNQYKKACRGLKNPKINPNDHYAVLNGLAKESLHLGDIATYLNCEMEKLLLADNTPCLFVENREIVRFIWESRYDQELAYLAADTKTTWSGLPRMNINGVDTIPCAFGCIDYFKDSKLIPNENKRQVLLTTWAFNECFCKNTPLNSRLVWRMLQHPEDFESYTAAPFDGHWTTKDHTLLNTLFRICLGVMVYAKAFPDYIISGLPRMVSIGMPSRANILTAAPEILEGATRTSVSMHIRAGHFKTLQHERFKRNEDGTPKVIFVRQTVVAGKLTPKTAVGL